MCCCICCHVILYSPSISSFLLLVLSVLSLVSIPLSYVIVFVCSLVCLLSLVSCCLGYLLSCVFVCHLSFELFVVVIPFPLSLASYYLGCMLSQLFLASVLLFCLFMSLLSNSSVSCPFVRFCCIYCPLIDPSVSSLYRLLCYLSVMSSVACLIRLQFCLFVMLFVY